MLIRAGHSKLKPKPKPPYPHLSQKIPTMSCLVPRSPIEKTALDRIRNHLSARVLSSLNSSLTLNHSSTLQEV